jgi:hypothetical protein
MASLFLEGDENLEYGERGNLGSGLPIWQADTTEWRSTAMTEQDRPRLGWRKSGYTVGSGNATASRSPSPVAAWQAFVATSR